jgi:ubiquinone/menaquinone biosynthesis C-methylase UbiE
MPGLFSRHFMYYQPEARSRQIELLEALSLAPSDVVLDVGCGTGYFTMLIKNKADHVVGVDIDCAALRIAGEFTPECDFINADVTKLPIKDKSATKVLCTEVLEHVEDDVGLMMECHRTLTDGGTLVCSSPNERYAFRSGKKSHTAKGPEQHVRAGYSPETLQRLLSKAGFSETSLRYALPMLGTLYVELLERTYTAIYRPLKSQSELKRISRSRMLALYKFLLPILLRVARIKFPENYGGSILIAKTFRLRRQVRPPIHA